MAAEGVTLLARLQADQAAARKAQEKDRVLLLGMVISELKNREIELRRDATDEDTADVIRKAIKKRREAVDLYRKADRAELADKEQTEATMLESYLPAQMSADAVRAVVEAAIAGGATNIGAVMGRVMPELKGKADGNLINTVVREALVRAAG
ncbi:MAG: GatB/YqeY domain-containing protein [Gemmatimonadaceae bacterium]|nr:GatB/YqeY domain-containing protein [Gemmatimonadaceae bacterium]